MFIECYWYPHYLLTRLQYIYTSIKIAISVISREPNFIVDDIDRNEINIIGIDHFFILFNRKITVIIISVIGRNVVMPDLLADKDFRILLLLRISENNRRTNRNLVSKSLF